MRVKIKRLNENAVIPKYGKPGDAGMDLTATEVHRLRDGVYEYRTGLSMEIPRGFVGYIFPRSSVHKFDVALANSVGVVDSGYRGEVMCTFRVDESGEYYDVGDRVAQMIIMPHPDIEFEEVRELETSERGEGRYGSTGN